MAKLPEFLRKNGYKCPSDPRKGSFQYAFQTDLEAFEYWAQSPDTLDNFNTFMMGNRAARPSWVDWFPVQKQLLDGLERGKDDVLLIDIAGGRGHDLQAFKTNYPQASGRLILQDTPSVIDDIKSLDESIERIKYDFFTPQPVKGNSSPTFEAYIPCRLTKKQELGHTSFTSFSMIGPMTRLEKSSATLRQR